jgi:NAD(P)H-hydrate epimerase
MEAIPAEVYAAAQVRAMDRYAIEQADIPGYTLMQRAGAAALATLQRRWPGINSIAVVCGSGNNAGDGYVLARLARAAGLQAQVFALTDPVQLKGDAARAFADFAAAGGSHSSFGAGSLRGVGLVVDALLGTGVDRPVAGALRDGIEAVNASGLPVLALDIPSGLDADTGLAHGVAVRATCTITFVGLKSGLYLGAAPDHVGELEFAGLDIPAAARATQPPIMHRIDETVLAAVLPPRRRAAHKGEHGRVLIIGGFAMAGAARLAGEAALRTGAGLVNIATTKASAAAIVAGQPELICHSLRSATGLPPLLAAADALAIGPGLGLGRGMPKFLEAAADAGKPLVVDADALTMLSRHPQQRAHWILTPHPGEAARLLGSDVASVQRDRLDAVREIAARYGGICVLKGANTLVHSATAGTWVCDRGNPGMATAGTGDVLTGIIAALLASGGDAVQCALAGVLLHAESGDRAARAGERGLIAGDLIAELHSAVNEPWK